MQEEVMYSTFELVTVGHYLQIPVEIRSNPCGPRILSGDLPCLETFKGNHNPSLGVNLFNKDGSLHKTTKQFFVKFEDVLASSRA